MKLHELFPEISLNPASAKDIKHWILQLAIEGKLTKKWRVENKSKRNNQLLNEIIDYNKNTYKVKPSKEISTTDDSLYPSIWITARTKDILTLRKGKNPKDLSEQIKRYPYLDIEALDRNNIRRWSDDEKVPMCTSNDILVVCDGSRSGLILQGANGVLGSTLAIIQTYPKIQSYVKILFQALFKELNTSMKGAAIPHLDTKGLSELKIGLPSLEEQQAIVKIVEDLFKEVDELAHKATQRIELKRLYAQVALKSLCEADTAAEWKQLVSVFPEIFNDKQTIKTLRETILQLAVQGKLTAKWRAENLFLSRASKLLEQIKAEKAQLIKEKKMKAEKPLPAIESDEIPFELPEGWVWCRLGEVISLKSGQDLKPHEYSDIEELGIPYITGASNLQNEKVLINRWTNAPRSIAYKGDLLLTCKGSGVGKMGWLDVDQAHIARQIMALNSKNVELNYLKLILDDKAKHFKEKANGLIPGIERNTVLIIIIGLPSIQEQQIIVEKVNALMGLCDELERGVDGLHQILRTL